MNKTAAKVAALMLEMASDKFSNHGCNDLILEATPENIQFVKDMIASGDYPDDVIDDVIHDGKIYTMDWLVMDYCRDLLLEIADQD